MSTRQTVLAEITKEKHNNAHHVIASLLKQYQEPLSEGPLPRLQNEYMVICKASQLDQLKPFAPLVEVHTVGDLEPHTSVAQKVHSLLREVTGRPETPKKSLCTSGTRASSNCSRYFARAHGPKAQFHAWKAVLPSMQLEFALEIPDEAVNDLCSVLTMQGATGQETCVQSKQVRPLFEREFGERYHRVSGSPVARSPHFIKQLVS